MAEQMLSEVQNFREMIGSLTNEQILEKLGDERISILKRFDVVGTVNRKELLCKAAVWLLVFIIFTVAVFFSCFNHKVKVDNKTIEASMGDKIIDGLYFAMVTLTTTGYGDIVPKRALAKLLISLLMLIGGFVSNILNKAISELLAWPSLHHPKKMMVLAWLVMLGDIAIGALAALLTDRKNIGTYPNGIYFAITSVTTVGYGDLSWKGKSGRISAIFWLLVTYLFFHHAFRCVSEQVTGFLLWLQGYGHKGISSVWSCAVQATKWVKGAIQGCWTCLNGWLEQLRAPST